ncbi:hypothetical protein [Cohnella rhizosphaerae]|uniref:Uncharacterized protein n=1 Tax=Cohnella rhizosphaerae TaxID=1457232 RepID=A0A9X4QU46_9BACL|nr:hypothetical protein [Cohnella rhizosphaerae]MDG0811360.1 hypothetical protein [Cohnella rhizosphaerae]
MEVNDIPMDAFSRFFASPFHEDPDGLMNAELIIRVDFFTQNITNLLDGFKLAGNSDAFFLSKRGRSGVQQYGQYAKDSGSLCKTTP